MNDPANDMAYLFCHYDYIDEQIEMFMCEYFQRGLLLINPVTGGHILRFVHSIGLAGGLYKGSGGDDDGFFFLPAYLNQALLSNK